MTYNQCYLLILEEKSVFVCVFFEEFFKYFMAIASKNIFILALLTESFLIFFYWLLYSFFFNFRIFKEVIL